MDTKRRTLVKAVVWQLLGFATMTLTGWIFTGSATQGGAIAVTGAFCGFVVYVIYERVWSRIRWGQLHTHSGDQGRLPDECLAARPDSNLDLRKRTMRLVTRASFPAPEAMLGAASGSARRTSDTSQSPTSSRFAAESCTASQFMIVSRSHAANDPAVGRHSARIPSEGLPFRPPFC